MAAPTLFASQIRAILGRRGATHLVAGTRAVRGASAAVRDARALSTAQSLLSYGFAGQSVKTVRQSRTATEAMCEDCDVELFLVLPRIIWLSFLVRKLVAAVVAGRLIC